MNMNLALPDNLDNDDHTEDFLKLLMANQHRTKAFIRIMVPNSNDAEDIMQETMLVMWRRFDTFKPGTNFVSWSVKIAHLQILNFRKKYKNNRMLFNEDLFKEFSESASEMMQDTDVRINALRDCIKKLNNDDQKLIQMRYTPNQSVKDMSQKTGIGLKTLYRVITRIQYLLHTCIQRRLLSEEN